MQNLEKTYENIVNVKVSREKESSYKIPMTERIHLAPIHSTKNKDSFIFLGRNVTIYYECFNNKPLYVYKGEKNDMSIDKYRFVSPGVQVAEIDLSRRVRPTAEPGCPVIIGRFERVADYASRKS